MKKLLSKTTRRTKTKPFTFPVKQGLKCGCLKVNVLAKC